MSKLFNFLLTPCLLVLILTASGAGQSSTATLSGTVEDERGALVPGAAITVKNYATSLERHATTNQSGSFTIPLLPPGEYTVLVEREGFTRVQLTNIVLNVGDQKAVQVQLKVGDVASTVEVRPDATLIRTDGSVGTVVDQQFVRNIPLNGRSLQSLWELTPGVVLTTGGDTTGQFSVNGQRAASNYFTVDGVSVNADVNTTQGGLVGQAGSGQLPAFTAQGTTSSLVSVDALQEFRIQTSTYAAEFGRQPGGQISLVTKSGTNEYHGTLFDYIRNDVFDANDWFANRNGLPKPPTRQHQFGGTFSGPLPFPNFGEGGRIIHSGKDRSFFFLSYEGLRLIRPRSLEIDVLSIATRNAALPAYKPFLNAFPVPNGPDLGNGAAKFAATWGDESNFDATSIRIDHTVGDFTVFGRLAHTPSHSKIRSGALSHNRIIEKGSDNITVGVTWTISDRIINDLRANYITNDGPFTAVPDNFGGAVVPSPESVFQSGRNPQTTQLLVSFPGISSGNWQWGAFTDFKQRQFNIVDNVSWTVGDHQLKFGADFRRSNPLLSSGLDGVQNLNFNLANLTSGTVSNYFQNVRDGLRHAAAFDNLSVYGQDTWQVNKRFTLTYGLRWEFVPPPHATEGGETITLDSFNPPFGSVAPLGTPRWETRYTNFAPRVGASYLLVDKPGQQLVLRGGAGIFYDLGLGNSSEGYGFAYPFAARREVSNVAFPLTPASLEPPVIGVSPPLALFVMDRNVVLPRTYQWNVSAERSLGSAQTLTVSFVGAEGRRLLKNSRYQLFLSQWPTARTTVTLNTNGGRSDYRSLQVQFQRRLSRGFQGLFSYTLGRSRDTASGDSFLSIPDLRAPVDLDYAFSDFDVRHNLTGAITYEVPDLKFGPILNAIINDWGVDVMFRARTAFPINVQTVTTFLNPGLPSDNEAVRPNVIPDVPIWIEDPLLPGGRRINNTPPTTAQVLAAGCVARTATNAKGAFCTPLPGNQGNLPRNALRGFAARQVDLALRREFGFHEKLKLQFRFEAFNLFNTPNFTNPQGAMNSSAFGLSGSMLNQGLGGLNSLYQIGGPRSMQAAIKILF